MHHRRTLMIVAVWLAPTIASAAETPSPAGAVLRLANGGVLPGTLIDAPRPGVVRWTSPAFVDPFAFRIGGINAVEFPAPATLPKPVGDFGFELSDGDVVFGSLLAMDEKVAEIDVPKLGRLHIERSRINRMVRWSDGAGLVYLGPNGLSGWIQATPKPAWRAEAGQLVADEPGASIRSDLGLPPKATIEIELAWKEKADFVLALGVGPDGANLKHAVRFEVWDGDLVVVRESDVEAELAPVQTITPGPGRIHLLVDLDQELGRVLVSSTGGKLLAELKGFGPKIKPSGGIALENKGGSLRLERLRVGRWDGEYPIQNVGDKTRVQKTDGTTVAGSITGYDAATKQFVVKDDGRETRVPADKVSGIAFKPTPDDRPRSIRLVLQDGARLSGDVTKVESGEIWMTCPGVVEPIHVASTAVRSLVGLRPDLLPKDKEPGTGRFEVEGIAVEGKLAQVGDPKLGGIGWQPSGSLNASGFRPGIAAKIVFREPKPPSPTIPQPPQVQQPARLAGGILRIFGGRSTPPIATVPTKPERKALHLRTGDVILAEVSKIDEDGVTFRTPSSEGTFVAHDKVKAIELSSDASVTIRINKSKRERLLTLPRMQKDSPPTQLIRSKTGDYLRGRVIKMDDKTLQVEVRLETKDVPRDRVSRIIWLHADEIEGAKRPPSAPVAAGTIRVQALKSDGYRLTFAADRLVDKTLYGKSDVLGACRVALDYVDQLLINGAIEQVAAGLPYQRWKLHNAVEPKLVSDDGDGGGGETNGTESPMVGKAAPDFTLDLLSGKPFHLADQKGKIVVLDFWATWCGPCLQAMPQVDRVTREFADRDVRLVAVNLQESPKEITAMLERHKLDMPVALDRDGATAEKYKANAIPQTVIIDRDGTVVRLFVGGGPHFDDQLRDALTAVLAGAKAGEAKK